MVDRKEIIKFDLGVKRLMVLTRANPTMIFLVESLQIYNALPADRL